MVLILELSGSITNADLSTLSPNVGHQQYCNNSVGRAVLPCKYQHCIARPAQTVGTRAVPPSSCLLPVTQPAVRGADIVSSHYRPQWSLVLTLLGPSGQLWVARGQLRGGTVGLAALVSWSAGPFQHHSASSG